jgi:multiple sugar transport system ATP-binding protein
MARIVLDQVTKVFDKDVVAVNDVSMEIGDGEFMVLVGPSGCGKSTLLRVVAGLEEPTYGEVMIGDRVVTDLPPKDRDVAMVFQNYALYPHMTVEQNLGIGLKLHHVPKAERAQKVLEVARTLGLEPLLKRKPVQLSGGQRQRVAMGRAMVREPLAFLMDEPLSNLDAKLRVQMRAELARQRDLLKTTTLYVTHDQVEAMTLGDRVAVINNGVVQQLATPQELYRSPANVFVAAFIGSPSMNLFEAEVDGSDLVFAAVRLPLPPDRDLRVYDGKTVVLGVRPADFEDAALARDDSRPTLDVVCDVTEELGDEMNVIFTLHARPVVTDATRAVRDEISDVEATRLGEEVSPATTVCTARLSTHSSCRPGERARLAVDTAALHFFDRESGEAIGRPATEAGAAEAPANDENRTGFV